MKKIYFLSVLYFFSLGVVAQESQKLSELESRVKAVETQLNTIEQLVKDVKEENTKLKEALKIGKPIVTFSDNQKLDYHVTSVIGNISAGSVTVSLQVVNNNFEPVSITLSPLGSKTPVMLNERGEWIRAEYISFGGGKGYHVVSVPSKIPMEATVVFKNIDPNTNTYLRNLRIQKYASGEKTIDIDFKELKIDWK